MGRQEAASNFLVPNATFLVELLAFIIILMILGRYVVPPINKAISDRQAAIKKEFDEAAAAQQAAQETEEQYQAALVEARHEAARIREEAREQGAAIMAEMREQAQTEANRIVSHAHTQLEAERQQVVNQLRAEVGGIATTLASTIVGEALEDDERTSRTVDRFVAELEGRSSNGATR
jgi:F-type H+-transporting ATPase subunit b